MEYFSEINLRRAQLAVISEYESEVKKISNSDTDGVLVSLLRVFSINNPLREKLCLLDAVSLPLSQICPDTKSLLIEKYLETCFVDCGRPQPNEQFKVLTLLVCKSKDRFYTFHVTQAIKKPDNTWRFQLQNGDIIRPFGTFALFSKKT